MGPAAPFIQQPRRAHASAPNHNSERLMASSGGIAHGGAEGAVHSKCITLYTYPSPRPPPLNISGMAS